jgi:transposase-like protein
MIRTGLATDDAHRGLVEAIGATLPGASWQRCRTHYAANLMSATPKSAWSWVKALLHSVYDQPDAESVHAQFDRVLDTLAERLPAVAAHLDAARADGLAADTDATPQPHGSRCPRAATEVNRTPWLDTRKLDTRKEAARQSARYLLTQVESPP